MAKIPPLPSRKTLPTAANEAEFTVPANSVPIGVGLPMTAVVVEAEADGRVPVQP